jgi:hypothetical protein
VTGAARLLARGWVVFCLYAGGVALSRALAAGTPPLDAVRALGVCVLLFGAMGILFIGGYGLSAVHLRAPVLSRLKPAHLMPGFNELVFIAFALLALYVQMGVAPRLPGGPIVAAVEGAIRFAVFGQRLLVEQLAACSLDSGRELASASSWMLAFIFLGSALSRIRLAAGIARLERKKRPEILGAQPLAFALGLIAVAGIQLLYVGTGYTFLTCAALGGVWGQTLIGIGPLALAYLITAALTNLLALSPDG